MKKVIELQNIKRDFQVGEENVNALRGVSFTINEGEFVTIMENPRCSTHWAVWIPQPAESICSTESPSAQ